MVHVLAARVDAFISIEHDWLVVVTVLYM